MWSAPFRPYEYWADKAEDEPDFLIEGMLHSATNTMSGKPTVGKTRLVAAMVAAIANEDEMFCGSKVVAHGPVMVISTDPGDTKRWGLRMREHNVKPERVGIAKFNELDWRLYLEQAKQARLLVLDNLTGALGANSIGDDQVARSFCGPLAEIAEHGTTVMMVAHSAKNIGTEKIDAPARPELTEHLVLYRVYDASDNLLYVGISSKWRRRFREHIATAEWMVLAARIELAHYFTRSEAEEAETEAIQSERPVFNIAKRDKTESVEAREEYMCNQPAERRYWWEEMAA